MKPRHAMEVVPQRLVVRVQRFNDFFVEIRLIIGWSARLRSWPDILIEAVFHSRLVIPRGYKVDAFQ